MVETKVILLLNACKTLTPCRPGTSFQWQLSNYPVDTSFNVQMYDIDLFDTPQSTIDALHAAGRIVICYFSAGSWEDWRADASSFPATVLGNNLDGWPGEKVSLNVLRCSSSHAFLP